MSMRALLMASVMACLLGCPPASEEDAAMSEGAMEPAFLRLEGDSQLSILPSTREPLLVRCVDSLGRPVPDIEVEFGITGSAEGASLEDARVVTDSQGFAMTTLVAGRAAPGFRVRASAPGAEPQYFEINVLKATEPMITVRVAYDGARTIQSNSVLVVEPLGNMKCEQLRTNTTDVRVSRTLMPGESADFPLGAGRSYLVAAWGSDESNSKLAWGCAEYQAPVVDANTASSEEVVVTLKDLAFTVASDYPLSLSVDLKSALGALAPIARAVVSEGLPNTATPQASFLLDALATKANFASTRQSEGLDALLQSVLDSNAVGPTPYANALAAAVSQDGATCRLSGVLTPEGPGAPGQQTQSSLKLTPPIYAVPSDSVAKEVSLSAVPLKEQAELNAPYDQATATVLIQTLKISIGFGSYAAYLLDAVEKQPVPYAERVLASAGCMELSALVAARPSSFAGITSLDALSVCRSALDAFVPKIRARWVALDAQRNTLSVTGSLSAHDRNGDGTIDDLGPAALKGAWSTPSAPVTPDTSVVVNVRMSPVVSSLYL